METSVKRPFSSETISQFIKFYNDGKTSSYIANLFNTSSPAIRYHLKKNNVLMRRATDYKTKVDDNYFNKIDSHEKAQILGFIYADGCISKNSLIISISIVDHDYLTIIKEKLNYQGKIGINKNRGYANSNLMCRLCVTSPKMIKDLSLLGVEPRKSLTLKFPTLGQVPEEFISSFILGYLEGDGCITIKKTRKSVAIQICGTIEFCEELKFRIFNLLGITSHVITPTKYKNSDINNRVFTIGGNQQVLKCLAYLYGKNQFKMDRKFQKYLDLKDLYINNLIKSRGMYKKHKKYEDIVSI